MVARGLAEDQPLLKADVFFGLLLLVNYSSCTSLVTFLVEVLGTVDVKISGAYPRPKPGE